MARHLPTPDLPFPIHHPSYAAWTSWTPHSGPCYTTTSTSWAPATISLDVEDADYARTLVDTLMHPCGRWPGVDDLGTVSRLVEEPERLKAIVDVLKNRLGVGGECAARALTLIPALPASSLADLQSEINKLADPSSGLTWGDCSVRATAAWYKPQAEEAKAERDEADNKRHWDTWQALYGRSRAAWLPPPDDSAYALPYSKMPSVESPKNPDGWRWVLMPAPTMMHYESGGWYPLHR